MTDECIECHSPLNENGKGKRKNMCPECFEEMCRDEAIDHQLQEWKDGERAINGRYRGQH